VEDQGDHEHSLVECLEAAGYNVTVVRTSQANARTNAALDYNLVILELCSLRLSAIEILRHLRLDNHQIPIYIITTSPSLEMKLLCFELGADDYIVQPVANAEILARVHAAFRRLSAPRGNLLTAAELRLDRSSHRVFRQDEEIRLTRKEFLLLEYLMLHPDEVISRPAIMRQVWEPGFDETGNIVDVYIRQLRRKIDEGHPQKLIHTVRGEGYLIRKEETFSEPAPGRASRPVKHSS
jgi:two-component system copper resistance phosphate regulon response regulator CusR